MNEIKSADAVIGGIFGWFFGGWDTILYLLVVFVAVDYVTGLLAASFRGEVSSRRGMKGILKKVLIFLLVGVGNGIDLVLGIHGDPMRTAVIFFYISNEGISILENTANLGVPIPSCLRRVLAELKEENHGDI